MERSAWPLFVPVRLFATALEQVVELVTEQGTEAMASVFATLLEIGMKLEREQVLGAQAYERTESRRGHASGYKPKTVDTRASRITVQVPKARDTEFYPCALEKWQCAALRRSWRP